ncbi:MAG: hypothetical protein ACRCTJ_03950 [Brevinema sp.]
MSNRSIEKRSELLKLIQNSISYVCKTYLKDLSDNYIGFIHIRINNSKELFADKGWECFFECTNQPFTL